MIKSLKKDLPLHLMILLPVVILVIYCYVPMMGIIIAFQNYMPALGFFRSKFIGVGNFQFLFTSPGFGTALFNTVYIALMKMILGIVVPVIFAILLNEVRITIFKKSFQTIVYLPYFVSWVLMAGIIVDILNPTNGIVNQFIGIFGIEPVFFLGDNHWFPYVMVITDIWKNFGWGTIIYMAALAGIDPTLYTAADIDGAGRWKQTVHITLPGIVPTIILMSVLSLGNVLNAGFDQIYNLMSPITMQSGDIIDTLVYRLGFVNGQYGLSTAAGLFKSLISTVLIILSYKLAYRFAGYKIF